jgi:hypothetical protein
MAPYFRVAIQERVGPDVLAASAFILTGLENSYGSNKTRYCRGNGAVMYGLMVHMEPAQ